MGAKGDTPCSDKFPDGFSCGGFPPLLSFSTNRNLHG
jgi:hypothetical protein